jgi:hypothetical protein
MCHCQVVEAHTSARIVIQQTRRVYLRDVVTVMAFQQNSRFGKERRNRREVCMALSVMPPARALP